MTDKKLFEQFTEIDEVLKYVGINATVLARFVTSDKPLNDSNEVLDYYDNPHIKNVLSESAKDLLSTIDELTDKIHFLKVSLSELTQQSIRDELENIFKED